MPFCENHSNSIEKLKRKRKCTSDGCASVSLRTTSKREHLHNQENPEQKKITEKKKRLQTSSTNKS